MNFGKFDRHITLLKPVAPAQNAYGETAPLSYVEVGKVYAEQKYAAGSEAFQAQELTAVQLVNWQLRYRADLNPTWLLAYGGNTYEITAVAEIGRRAGLTLTTRTRPAPPVAVAVPVVAAGGLDYLIPFALG
jgi:SPP1 family predicted phage head-tail adaptor